MNYNPATFYDMSRSTGGMPYNEMYSAPAPVETPGNYGVPGLYNPPMPPAATYLRTAAQIPSPAMDVEAVNDPVLEKEMHEVRAPKKTRRLISAVRARGARLSTKDLRKILHVFSPGGKLRLWVMVACLVFLAAELVGFLSIDAAMTVGGSSATSHSIAIFPYAGMMLSAGVIVCAFFGVLSKEDGTIIAAAAIGLTLFLGSSVLQGLVLWDSASLTTSGCTGVTFPETTLRIFCTHYDVLTDTSYVTDPLVPWSNLDGRTSIIDQTICRNRSFLWGALFITCSLFAIHVGLLAAQIWYAWSMKVSISDAIDQMWGNGISEDAKEPDE